MPTAILLTSGGYLLITRPALVMGRAPIATPAPEKLLTEDDFFLITEDAAFLSLEVHGQ